MTRPVAVLCALSFATCLPWAAGAAEQQNDGGGDAAPESTCLRDCGGALACEMDVVDCLLGEERARAAVERLKPLVEEHPDEPGWAALLARAYLADSNPFWAQRTLQQALDRNPGDCGLRARLAWLHIGQGDLDLAREVLDREGCPDDEIQRGRWLLLRAFMADAEEDPEAAALVSEAGGVDALYPEDARLHRHLRGKLRPGWIQPLHLSLETELGYTSNAKAGSPTDPSTEGEGSLLGRMDLFGRFVWPLSGSVRPALETGLKGHGLAADEARRLSYLELAARPGVILGAGFPRLLVGYKVDYLVLNQDSEIRRRFYEGHRGELELETEALTAFAGAGRRIFHENGRSRWEFDGGLGVSLAPLDRLRLLLALSLRGYQAVGDPYDLLGATALAVGRLRVGPGLIVRLGLTLSVDGYPNSGGERGKAAYGTDSKRFDLLTKASAGLWSPSWGGLRAGLSYGLSWRDSTVDESNSIENYDYIEHRALFKLRWAFDLNPWAPRVVEPEGHLPIDYGVGAAGGLGMDEERIQDLLRQDEAARRGSSCVD